MDHSTCQAILHPPASLSQQADFDYRPVAVDQMSGIPSSVNTAALDYTVVLAKARENLINASTRSI